ncbi:MAG: hypothetical protein ACXQTD_02300 [Candidatus Syntropharchaeia archaeon]
MRKLTNHKIRGNRCDDESNARKNLPAEEVVQGPGSLLEIQTWPSNAGKIGLEERKKGILAFMLPATVFLILQHQMEY